ncbi:hypothetical protein Taro_008600, partial [Colocasia esculenta]|nr:hypothetical protein [Colocasia esculenta]
VVAFPHYFILTPLERERGRERESGGGGGGRKRRLCKTANVVACLQLRSILIRPKTVPRWGLQGGGGSGRGRGRGGRGGRGRGRGRGGERGEGAGSCLDLRRACCDVDAGWWRRDRNLGPDPMSNDDDKVEGSEESGGSRKRVPADGGTANRKKIRSSEFWGFSEGRNAISLNRSGGGAPSDRLRPQDADYRYLPSVSDELALLILARLPRSVYPRLCLVNWRYHSLVRSDELYAIRREIGVREPSVFMLASGEPHWWSYDPRSGARRNLPILPSDVCFSSFDKETLCIGTHLLVSGKETGGSVIWRYELPLDRWFKGPPMISPRSLFASANCGKVACVAGGIGPKLEVLNTAEKYNPDNKTWDPLPRMKKRRKLCSGCYMDGRFYVIGGLNEEGKNLTCGEYYDPDRSVWVLVPDMMKDAPSWSSRSPPLVAVVNNELYSLEASSNQLKVYLKKSNSWKDLGEAPVRADHSRGWGVAFKSLGDELLVIGTRADNYTGRGMTICTCSPDPDLDTLHWRVLDSDGRHWSSFIFNCSIMLCEVSASLASDDKPMYPEYSSLFVRKLAPQHGP